MATRHDIEDRLQAGIVAAKTGQLVEARSLLLDVVEQDQTNETAWYWLYQVFERPDDKRVCLENLITINPANQWAHRELLHQLSLPVAAPSLDRQQSAAEISLEETTPSRNGQDQAGKFSLSHALTIKLVAAFWAGISLILLSGGIMAGGEWLVSGLRSRTFPDHITYYQAFELLVAIVLIIAGLIGLNVAAALYLKSMAGFYGSLFLALGLLLIGPTISLVASPPSYVTLVCTGGIAGMIFLLTLASQPGFKDDHKDDD